MAGVFGPACGQRRRPATPVRRKSAGAPIRPAARGQCLPGDLIPGHGMWSGREWGPGSWRSGAVRPRSRNTARRNPATATRPPSRPASTAAPTTHCWRRWPGRPATRSANSVSCGRGRPRIAVSAPSLSLPRPPGEWLSPPESRAIVGVPVVRRDEAQQFRTIAARARGSVPAPASCSPTGRECVRNLVRELLAGRAVRRDG